MASHMCPLRRQLLARAPIAFDYWCRGFEAPAGRWFHASTRRKKICPPGAADAWHPGWRRRGVICPVAAFGEAEMGHRGGAADDEHGVGRYIP